MTFFDQIPLFLIMAGSVLAMVLFIEIGFRLGKNRKVKPYKLQTAQVRAIMGASLGLLAFMLAFTFSMAQQHFEERTQAYMLEVSAIDSAYRGADLLDDDARRVARDILRRFTRLRLETASAVNHAEVERVVAMINESEKLHDSLWAIAETAMDRPVGSLDSGLFAQSVLAMINAHDARLQAALFNRISPVIWLTLFLIALMSMIVMGYQAGLTGTRSGIATWTLALTFSAVMTLVTDLDRPKMTLFQMNHQLMEALESRMNEAKQSGAVDQAFP